MKKVDTSKDLNGRRILELNEGRQQKIKEAPLHFLKKRIVV